MTRLKKAIEYIEERDISGQFHGDDAPMKNWMDVKHVITRTTNNYSLHKKTDEENHAFDDGYDAGYLAGLMEGK